MILRTGGLAVVLAGCAGGAKDKGGGVGAPPAAVAPAGGAPTAVAPASHTAAAGDSFAAPPVPQARHAGVPTVLFVGTSLTAGLGLNPAQAYPVLVQQLARAAGEPIVAVNAGVSGETSAGARQRIGWVLRHTPADIVVIETGANDALRALPVSEARANIAAVVDSVHRIEPGARVALVQMEAPPNLGPAYTTAFHAMYGDIARREHATLIPFLLDSVAGIPALNQGDGLHPNVTGERIVARNVWAALEPLVRATRLALRGGAAAPGRGG